MKAIILAAGLGTRLKQYTLNKPKALVEINGKPLIALVLEKLVFFGFDEIVVNAHHFAGQITDYLSRNDFGVKIHISDETSQLLDTGGGIFNAKSFLEGVEPFLVHNVDIISDIDINEMMNFHLSTNSLATLAVGERESSRKLLFDPQMLLSGWRNLVSNASIIADKNKVNLTEFAFAGIHILNPKIFSLFNSSNQSFPIVDAYLKLCSQHRIVGFDTTHNFIIDVGKVNNLQEATQFLLKNKGF